jgi:PAP2 superfamily protein
VVAGPPALLVVSLGPPHALQRVPAPGRRPLVWRVASEHGLFLALIGAYVTAGLLAEWIGVVPGFSNKVLFVYAYALAPVLVWVPPLCSLIRKRWAVRDECGRRVHGWAGWRVAWHGARRGAINNDRLGGLVLVAALTPLLMNTFGAWKSSIPAMVPFQFDPLLAAFDRSLHFGRDPWQWLQPILGRPGTTVLLDQLYWLWILLIPGVVLWQAWNADMPRRRQFLVAFVFIWILLGTVLATALSSAGPCFYARIVGGADPFAPLLTYLDAVDQRTRLHARYWQDVLWWAYQIPEGHPYTRISAMPSLHVAMPVLCTLAAWPAKRWLAMAFAGLTAITLVASVHLGWHYALDGEVSLLLVPLIWWGSGWLTRRQGHG